MTNFDTIDQYLNHDHYPDFWSDDGIGVAQSMVQQLSPEEMSMLKSAWPQRSEAWQERCAQVVPHGTPAIALEILIEMFEAKSRDVRLAAADSLRDMDLADLTPEQRRHVQRRTSDALTASKGKLETSVLRVLQNKLDAL